MWPPPTPSQLCGTWSISFGMNPPTSVPVVSVRYFPTTPLELASPCGNCDDLELSRMRDDSHELAARTTTRARTCSSRPVAVLMYDTPVASPCEFTVTSRAIALVMMRRRFVRCPGISSTLGDEKFELVM